mmetsp:Transcript_20258/g.28048  ORF Transcript_20258/g.28048 Transcript_20258/m.28048 type:complete len:212 (+) Transcript_20258:101-736(+)
MDSPAHAHGTADQGAAESISISPPMSVRSSSSELSLMAQLAECYTFDFRPEYRTKFRKTFEHFTLGANLSLDHPLTQPLFPSVELVLKPGRVQRAHGKANTWWRQVAVKLGAVKDVRLLSRPMQLGGLCLQIGAGLRRPVFKWKLTLARDRHFQKQQYKRAYGPLEGGFSWDFVQQGPSMEGGFGSDEDPMAWDCGKFHLSVPRVQVSFKC